MTTIGEKLFKKSKTGKDRWWFVYTLEDEVVTEYGEVDGETQVSRKKATPKNVGKVNATTAEQQAILEARSLHIKQRDKGYLPYALYKEQEGKVRIAPMLAPSANFEDTKKYVKYPCHVQPKLDGARCLAVVEEGGVKLLSRGNKDWNLPHIASELAKGCDPGTILDGELFSRVLTRQEIMSRVSRGGESAKDIEFWVYDVPRLGSLEKAPWNIRCLWLNLVNLKFPYANSCIRFVPTSAATTEEKIWDLHESAVSNGYEGVMVRNVDGLYEYGHRSKNLLKVKAFQDSEFTIIGAKEGIGKNVGAVTWRCVTPEGKEFDCDPLGTYEERKQWYADREQYIGKKLTVKYQGFTDDGIPCFPKGVSIRLEEDMGQ